MSAPWSLDISGTCCAMKSAVTSRNPHFVVEHVTHAKRERNSPPRLGGVAARIQVSQIRAQTGWSINAATRSFESVRFASIYKVVSRRGSTTPPLADKTFARVCPS